MAKPKKLAPKKPLFSPPVLGDATWVALMMRDIPLELIKIAKDGYQKRLKSSAPAMADHYIKSAHDATKKFNAIISRTQLGGSDKKASLKKSFYDKVVKTGNFNAAIDEVIRLSGDRQFSRVASMKVGFVHEEKAFPNFLKTKPVRVEQPYFNSLDKRTQAEEIERDIQRVSKKPASLTSFREQVVSKLSKPASESVDILPRLSP
jgi:hypothetical protein